jgi:SAM-dependent methyltransferase
MLQAIDSNELSTLLPSFLAEVHTNTTAPISLLDLGCGTGRNTTHLLTYPWPRPHPSITALDFSTAMLALAAPKLRPLATSHAIPLHLAHADCFPTATSPHASPLPYFPTPPAFSALISTLVLEHVPLRAFFATLAALLAPGGRALVSNMHADMGAVSAAGFVGADGVKVRGTSFAHGVEETVDEARRGGFEVVRVWERGVCEEDVASGVVGPRGRKWVGWKVWMCFEFRKVEG